jgi:hypothetical protein
VLVRSCWDYHTKPAAFLAALDALAAAGLAVLNPPSLIRWNTDKRYLARLAGQGPDALVWSAGGAAGGKGKTDGANAQDDGAHVRTIPTCFAPMADTESVERAFAQLQCEAVVVKPVVGAGSWRQARLQRGEALPSPDLLPAGPCLIQVGQAILGAPVPRTLSRSPSSL